jgi:hypothetical protein
MAKKFSELKGTSLIVIRGGKQETVYYAYEDEKCKFESYGDTIYMLDKANNYEIVELVTMRVSRDYRNIVRINAVKAENIDKVKDYIPYYYDTKSYGSYLIKFSARGNRSHYGLFFTDIKEAEKYQKQIREGVAFIYLKKGDPVYLVLGGNELMTCEVNDIREGKESGGHDQFLLGLKGLGAAMFDQMRYEERATGLLETYFYTYKLELPYEQRDGIKLFVRKEDAEKSIKETEQRKKKSATSKYIQKLENHDGKPISHTDKQGKQLHYGDRVAYAVSGGSSYPYISFGIVNGESKERVSIVDEIPITMRNGETVEHKHSVSPRCILLIKEAEFNEKSGYSFVKSK